jgi:hypothetical protein
LGTPRRRDNENAQRLGLVPDDDEDYGDDDQGDDALPMPTTNWVKVDRSQRRDGRHEQQVRHAAVKNVSTRPEPRYDLALLDQPGSKAGKPSQLWNKAPQDRKVLAERYARVHAAEDAWALAAQHWLWNGLAVNALKHTKRR